MTLDRQSRGADIIVVGASLAGLAMARALALALGPDVGISLIEARADPGPGDRDPRAFALSAGSRRLLQALGVWPALSPHAQPVQAVDITDSGLEHAIRPVLISYDNRVGADEPATWIVEAARLRAALFAALGHMPSIACRFQAEVQDFAADDAGVSLALRGGERLRARLLVAADGQHSPLRDLAGIRTVRWAHPQIGIVATVAHERPHEARAVQHFLPAGPFAILPLVGNRACVTWTEDKDRGRAILERDDAGFLAALEQRFGYRLGALALAGPRASWPLEFRMARALTAPRFALIGDSVRSVHPIAGQGLNLGLRDVAALAECLADAMRLGLDPGDGMALERYARWRHFDSITSSAAFEALNALFSNDHALVRAARDAGLALIERLPAIKAALVSEAAGQTGEVPRLLRGEMA